MIENADAAEWTQSAEVALSAWEDPPRVNRRDAAPVLAVAGFAAARLAL